MLQPTEFRRAVLAEGGLSRRLFLAYSAALSSVPLLGNVAQATTRLRNTADPFALGVASGDPNEHSMVLWTRLAPQPLEPFGGMPAEAVEVEWQVAEDDGMRKVVASGKTLATPQLGHSVHAEPRGLKPDRWYWYRFRSRDAESPIGRTRTMPAPNAMPEQLNFAFASCQHFEDGLFTAYEQMAADELDLVFHLGDYIYEYQGYDNRVRKHLGQEIESLEDYRRRLSQYRADPLLNTMHARCPWFVTWDDHEFDNNYAGGISEEVGIDATEFLLRRANSYQAYYEMMPLRRNAMPVGPNMRLYRSAKFGRLAEFQVLDTRQYRTDQPNGDRAAELNDLAMNRNNSLLGRQQRNWLTKSLVQSEATWNILAQQVMMGMVGFTRGGSPMRFSMDQWPGYAYERMRLMEFLAERRVPNPVVLTGDIHSNWVNDLRVDDRRGEDPVVATEFVGTSITSGGNGQATPPELDTMLRENPCIKFHNRERGYVRCNVTPESWTSDYMVVSDVTKPGGTVTSRASFVVEAGQPGAHQA